MCQRTRAFAHRIRVLSVNDNLALCCGAVKHGRHVVDVRALQNAAVVIRRVVFDPERVKQLIVHHELKFNLGQSKTRDGCKRCQVFACGGTTKIVNDALHMRCNPTSMRIKSRYTHTHTLSTSDVNRMRARERGGGGHDSAD
jgi:hypothetical protein